VFTIDRLGETFNQTVVPLRYTPRKFILHPTQQKALIILESDQGAFTTEERNKKEAVETAGEDEEMADGENCDSLPDEQYGYPKAEVNVCRVLEYWRPRLAPPHVCWSCKRMRQPSAFALLSFVAHSF
jgi:hypothetical protein